MFGWIGDSSDRYISIPCHDCTAPVDFRGEWNRDEDGAGLAVSLIHRDCECEWTDDEENSLHDQAQDAMQGQE